MNDQEEVASSRAAVVTAGVVTNVILVNPPQEDGEEFVLEGSEIVLLTSDSPVDVGWIYNNEAMEFSSPPDD